MNELFYYRREESYEPSTMIYKYRETWLDMYRKARYSKISAITQALKDLASDNIISLYHLSVPSGHYNYIALYE